MGPGPVASGAQARATMVAMDPRTCAQTRVKMTWKRVSVWRRIMPKPTPWMASRVPSHSQRVLPASAPASGEPAHGTHDPMPETAHSIWHQRGAPRPTANMGRIHEWRKEALEKMANRMAHTPMKKPKTRRTTIHVFAWLELQRYRQLRPYGADRKKFWMRTVTKNQSTILRRITDL